MLRRFLSSQTWVYGELLFFPPFPTSLTEARLNKLNSTLLHRWIRRINIHMGIQKLVSSNWNFHTFIPRNRGIFSANYIFNKLTSALLFAWCEVGEVISYEVVIDYRKSVRMGKLILGENCRNMQQQAKIFPFSIIEVGDLETLASHTVLQLEP